jgi:hypothetical protein
VVLRHERFFVRYDAGAHQVAWREEKITKADLGRIVQGEKAAHSLLLELQKRLQMSGADPYVSNWQR